MFRPHYNSRPPRLIGSLFRRSMGPKPDSHLKTSLILRPPLADFGNAKLSLPLLLLFDRCPERLYQLFHSAILRHFPQRSSVRKCVSNVQCRSIDCHHRDTRPTGPPHGEPHNSKTVSESLTNPSTLPCVRPICNSAWVIGCR